MLALTLATILISERLATGQDRPFAAELAEFKRLDRANPQPKGQILFIGSSSFTRWTKVQDAFPDFKILNRAFGGSSLPNLIANVDTIVKPYRPCQIVIYCGENDFAGDETLAYDAVVGRFKTLFGSLRKVCPGAAIGYVSMKPSPSRWHMAHKFIAANAAIKEFLSTKPRTAFVDVWPSMLGANKEPKPEIFVEDKLHMNQLGYELWTPQIRSILSPKGKKSKSVFFVPKPVQEYGLTSVVALMLNYMRENPSRSS